MRLKYSLISEMAISCLWLSLHTSAHFLQACAHALHLSLSDFSHSIAQASQASAHKEHIFADSGLPLMDNFTHKLQISAHSRHFLKCSSCALSPKQQLKAQSLHALKHSRHSLIHLFMGTPSLIWVINSV